MTASLTSMSGSKASLQEFREPAASELENSRILEEIYSSTIFDNCVEQFNIPLVDFDPCKGAELVRRGAMLPASRKKYLVGVLRGSGGGKIRALEEVKYQVMLRDKRMDSLAIAITFNSNWEISQFDKKICDDEDVRTVFATIRRMASCFYGVENKLISTGIIKMFRSIFEPSETTPCVVCRFY